MDEQSRSYELWEYTAEQALQDNIKWFSHLSPGDKIRAIEQEVKTITYLASLKKVEPKDVR